MSRTEVFKLSFKPNKRIGTELKAIKLIPKIPIFFMISLLLGTISGAITAVFINKGEFNAISKIIISFLEQRNEQRLLNTFISALTPNIICWLTAFICGFCAVSAPITALIPFIRSMGYSLTATYIIISYSLNGVKYIISHLMFNYLISVIALIFCCCESINMSITFWQTVCSSKKASYNNIQTAVFCGKMLIYGLIILAAAILEAYTYI